jgi:hypothetical protein
MRGIMTSKRQAAVRQIPKGCFGVRYASDDDHLRNGWIYRDCFSVRSAVDAADMFLKEHDYRGVMLLIVDHYGNEQERCSWE